MTYCLGMLVEKGLVMMADTRTNAGVDNISTFRKLNLYGNDGQRLIAVATAGSLSTTQATLQRVVEGVTDPASGARMSFDSFSSIWEAARSIGQALRSTRDDLQAVAQGGAELNATLLVGGSIAGEKTRLFMIYGAGNAIECGPDTPFLQIGEAKYGKPILDRALTHETPLAEAVKIGLLSYNATLRSNLAVGMPIDLLVACAGAGEAERQVRVEPDDPYWAELDRRWGEAMRAAQASVPMPPFLSSPS